MTRDKWDEVASRECAKQLRSAPGVYSFTVEDVARVLRSAVETPVAAGGCSVCGDSPTNSLGLCPAHHHALDCSCARCTHGEPPPASGHATVEAKCPGCGGFLCVCDRAYPGGGPVIAGQPSPAGDDLTAEDLARIDAARERTMAYARGYNDGLAVEMERVRGCAEKIEALYAAGASEAEEKLAAEKRYSRDLLRATTLDIATRDGTILALEYRLRQTMVVVQAAQVVAAWSTEGTGRCPERLLAELREAVKKLEAALPSAPPSV